MKKALLVAMVALSAKYGYSQTFDGKYLKVIGDRTKKISTITQSRTLDADSAYLLSGIVYVKNGAKLTIPAGTLILGDTLADQRGVLVITREGSIDARGTKENPIVFTSARKVGQKKTGDWGGIVIFGKAPMNQDPEKTEYEKGIIINPADANDAHFGGSDANHSSGYVEYVRLEYGGFPLITDGEINGITFGGVGKGTSLHHIQVSYSGDDAFEWFGGNVNAHHLVAYKTFDDDFDTDYGFSGKVQFGVSLRDKDLADKSGSTGFESDNDGSGTAANPFTSVTFSNFTLVGPNDANANQYFTRAMHLRRNTSIGVYNTLAMGWPEGVYIEGAATGEQIKNNNLRFKNNLVQSLTTGKEISGKSDLPSDLNLSDWFSANGNTKVSAMSGFMLTDPQNMTGMPDLRPQTGSSALSGADFSDASLSGMEQVDYRGAFKTDNWMASWTNFRPDTTNYLPGALRNPSGINSAKPAVEDVVLYPNPTNGNARMNFYLPSGQNLDIRIFDVAGKEVLNVANNMFIQGNNTLNLNTANLENGMYVIRVAGSNGQVSAFKMSVLK